MPIQLTLPLHPVDTTSRELTPSKRESREPHAQHSRAVTPSNLEPADYSEDPLPPSPELRAAEVPASSNPLGEATPLGEELFAQAHAELATTLLGLQNKLHWPAYQAPWEKARAAILAGYGISVEGFYAELRMRLEAKRAKRGA